eukprot:9380885-Lingulodinium_polyedra.AAC.1
MLIRQVLLFALRIDGLLSALPRLAPDRVPADRPGSRGAFPRRSYPRHALPGGARMQRPGAKAS